MQSNMYKEEEPVQTIVVLWR